MPARSCLEDRDLALVGLLGAAESATDDGKDVNGAKRDPGDEDALGRNGEVGRSDGEPVRFDGEEVIGENSVEDRSIAEAHADPQAAGFRAAGKSAVVQIGERFIEILNKTKDFHILIGEREDVAVTAEHFHAGERLKGLGVHETINMITFKAQDPNAFVGRTTHRMRMPLSNIFRLIVSLVEWPVRVR